MEYAQFGDTELTVSDLKSNIDKLKAVPDGKTESKMQNEFEVGFQKYRSVVLCRTCQFT